MADRLKLVDFVAKNDDVDLDDFSDRAQNRINDALADLTGTSTPPSPGPQNIIVSKDRDSSLDGIFEEIQAAIDDSDTNSGDTVYVEPGSYDENVTIDKADLTLRATGPGESTIEGRVEATSDGVTLDGFDISPPPATSNQSGEAVKIGGDADDVVVKNNVVRDFSESGVPKWEGIDAIVAFGGNGNDALDNIEIINNDIKRIEGRSTKGGVAGISIQGNVDGATVRNNSIEDIGQSATAWGFGVVIRGTGNHNKVPENVTVKDNSISNVLSNPSTDTFGVGLGVEADGSNYTFENNSVDNAELGAEIKKAAGQTTLTGNSFTGTTIHLGDRTDNVGLTGVINNNSFDRAVAVADLDPSSSLSSAGYERVILPNIQPAVDSAASGGGLNVADGTYNEAVTIDVSGLTIQSLSGAGSTTVEASAASQNNKVFQINGVSGVTIEGLEITFDGTDSSNGEKYGIRARAGSDGLTVQDCDIGGFSASDVASNTGAVRTSGITVTSKQGSNAGTPVKNPTIENNSLHDMKCTGGVDPNNSPDKDSKAKGIALNGDVQGATLAGNTIRNIGSAGGPNESPNSAEAVSDPGVEGTEKPRGISLIENDSGVGPTDFDIDNNVLGGTGSDAIVGTWGQPAIFIGGTNSLGSTHDVRDNEFYHPVDNLSSDALELNGDNTYYDTSGNTQTPSLVPADADEDGGNLIDRGSGAYNQPDV